MSAATRRSAWCLRDGRADDGFGRGSRERAMAGTREESSRGAGRDGERGRAPSRSASLAARTDERAKSAPSEARHRARARGTPMAVSVAPKNGRHDRFRAVVRGTTTRREGGCADRSERAGEPAPSLRQRDRAGGTALAKRRRSPGTWSVAARLVETSVVRSSSLGSARRAEHPMHDFSTGSGETPPHKWNARARRQRPPTSSRVEVRPSS